MIEIFADHITPRLTFVLDFCFKEKGVNYMVHNQIQDWPYEAETSFNYSTQQIDADYAIEPQGLLADTDIDQHLRLEMIGEKMALRGDTDPLAVIFYLLSRYEEYQPFEKDQHGRFSAQQSQQFHFNVLDRPVVDKIVKKLWLKLGLDYEEVEAKFEFVPSFDIDVAWAYKNRPFWRKVGAFSHGRILERLGVLWFGKKDPYDTYGKIVQISSQLNRIICFTPVSDYGPLDKNISYKNESYRSLIRGLNADGGLGLHPGYQSFLKKEKIEEEKQRLEDILGHEMPKSRFHYLRLQIPQSYQIHIACGFEKDYSMGYADHFGFRAGTSFPFYFFDLEKNSATNLLLFPFTYMDATFKDYMKLSVEESLVEVEKMMQEVKSVGGLFMCIWHNHTISNQGEWEGWFEVLEKSVEWGKQ